MVSITTISESLLSEIARIDCTETIFVIFVALNTRDLSLLKEKLVYNKRYPYVYSIQTSHVPYLDAICINTPFTDDCILVYYNRV